VDTAIRVGGTADAALWTPAAGSRPPDGHQQTLALSRIDPTDQATPRDHDRRRREATFALPRSAGKPATPRA
jgi:hypothetical protein